MSALVWWLIPLVACTGALLYVWWSIAAKNRQNTYKSIAEYETFRSAFAKDSPPPFSKSKSSTNPQLNSQEVYDQSSDSQLSSQPDSGKSNQGADGEAISVTGDRNETSAKVTRKKPVRKSVTSKRIKSKDIEK